jgi:hypothetical protein
MKESAFKEGNENPNHITQGEEYCEYLGDKFHVKYSGLGISQFRYPMYSRVNPEVVCMELRTPNCPFRDNLTRLIMEL